MTLQRNEMCISPAWLGAHHSMANVSHLIDLILGHQRPTLHHRSGRRLPILVVSDLALSFLKSSWQLDERSFPQNLGSPRWTMSEARWTHSDCQHTGELMSFGKFHGRASILLLKGMLLLAVIWCRSKGLFHLRGVLATYKSDWGLRI